MILGYKRLYHKLTEIILILYIMVIDLQYNGPRFTVQGEVTEVDTTLTYNQLYVTPVSGPITYNQVNAGYIYPDGYKLAASGSRSNILQVLRTMTLFMDSWIW